MKYMYNYFENMCTKEVSKIYKMSVNNIANQKLLTIPTSATQKKTCSSKYMSVTTNLYAGAPC